MAYKRKTFDTYELRANYGFGHGFECVCAEETRKAALAQRKCYRENGDFAPMKIVRIRERIESPENGLLERGQMLTDVHDKGLYKRNA